MTIIKRWRQRWRQGLIGKKQDGCCALDRGRWEGREGWSYQAVASNTAINMACVKCGLNTARKPNA